jgi:hypothetical protein
MKSERKKNFKQLKRAEVLKVLRGLRFADIESILHQVREAAAYESRYKDEAHETLEGS